jgi:hypothetical protein
VDAAGLYAMDRRYPRRIAERHAGGPVGVETLAAALAEARDTLEGVIEPFWPRRALCRPPPAAVWWASAAGAIWACCPHAGRGRSWTCLATSRRCHCGHGAWPVAAGRPVQSGEPHAVTSAAARPGQGRKRDREGCLARPTAPA